MMRMTALVAVLLGLYPSIARAEAPPPPSPEEPSPAAAPPASSATDASPPAASAAPKCSGTVVGTVRDAASRAPLSDLVVTATSSAVQGERIVVTSASGEYRIPELPPGEYTIRFEKEGYKPFARGGVAVAEGQTSRADAAVMHETVKSQEVLVVDTALSARERSVNSLLLPAGSLELGGELTFLVSDSSPKAGERLSFTDVGFMTLNGRYSFGPVELAAATDLLIKQPSYLDEPIPQAGSLSVLVALGERQAVALSGAIGPLLLDQGRWESATLALHAKRSVHETLLFKGSLGGNFTHLGLAAGPRQALWFSEVVVALEAVLRTPIRAFAVWTGADLHIPVAKSPDSEGPDQAGNLDPQVRLNFVVAAAYSFVRDWDLLLRLAVIDRGDKENPQSTLPILNGGFDQQQITLGVVHNWGFEDR
jgi:hypothetical protein